MADRNNIDEFVKLFEEKLYEKLPFSIFQHEKDDEREYVMFKVTSTYKGTMYRYRHIIDYVEINKFYDIMYDLEKLADYTVELLQRGFSNKLEEIQGEEGQERSDYHCYLCAAKNEEPCIVCGKPTNQIDIHHEVRVCSIECAYVLDMEQAEQESDGDDE